MDSVIYAAFLISCFFLGFTSMEFFKYRTKENFFIFLGFVFLVLIFSYIKFTMYA